MVGRGGRWLGACCIFALAAVGCGDGGTSSAQHPPATASSKTATTPELHGTKPIAVVGRPTFTLTDTSGHAYDFYARTRGTVTLLYAGYTHCSDDCPATMAASAAALRMVPASVADHVVVVFMTVDPHRDTRRRIRTWLDRFHPPSPFVGLRGTPAQLARIEVSLGMPVATRQRANKSDHTGGYGVNHYDGLLIYGRDNDLATIYPSGLDFKPTTLAKDLTTLVGST